jgi:hypothetical protein
MVGGGSSVGSGSMSGSFGTLGGGTGGSNGSGMMGGIGEMVASNIEPPYQPVVQVVARCQPGASPV